MHILGNNISWTFVLQMHIVVKSNFIGHFISWIHSQFLKTDEKWNYSTIIFLDTLLFSVVVRYIVIYTIFIHQIWNPCWKVYKLFITFCELFIGSIVLYKDYKATILLSCPASAILVQCSSLSQWVFVLSVQCWKRKPSDWISLKFGTNCCNCWLPYLSLEKSAMCNWLIKKGWEQEWIKHANYPDFFYRLI